MKYYIVCSADNIGYELTVSKPVTTYDEAQKIMSEEMEEVLSNIEEEEIESKNIGSSSFHILCNNSDVFYGQIKEIEVIK